jgi:saccharopine dehydrogenase (NAD+, L-lysine forming)
VKLGLIREGKTPPDKRVVLSPLQCKQIIDKHPHIAIVVEKSSVRKYPDADYENLGITVVDDMTNCDILLGVKEVPKEMLIPNKTYFFFSHTIKKQPYNRQLLQEIVQKKIRLIDWETLTDSNKTRLIGFGKYAGIVGTYNGFLTYGKRFNLYELKPANLCEDRNELNEELQKVKLPPIKIAITGNGRVANGAIEILEQAGIKKVSPQEYLHQQFDEPVYTQLSSGDYFKTKDGSAFDKSKFYADSSSFESDFFKWAKITDLFLPCHFWKKGNPLIISKEELAHPLFNIKVIADISCDIHEPIASTIRPSTIANPIYGVDKKTLQEVPFNQEGAVTVMAVDNLPCELPKNASEDFGVEFIEKIFPHLLNGDAEGVLKRATITENGSLTPNFAYLQDYLDGK